MEKWKCDACSSMMVGWDRTGGCLISMELVEFTRIGAQPFATQWHFSMWRVGFEPLSSRSIVRLASHCAKGPQDFCFYGFYKFIEAIQIILNLSANGGQRFSFLGFMSVQQKNIVKKYANKINSYVNSTVDIRAILKYPETNANCFGLQV